MDNWFQSKWFMRLLGLAFAITLYIFVNVEINSSESDSAIPGRNTQLQTLDDIPVEIRIDSESYVVSGVPEYASLSIEGTPAIVTPTILNRNFSVYVDLNGLEEGVHTVELEHDITNDLNVYIEPKTIEVTIEERANEVFPISVEFLNKENLPSGYEVGNYELQQPYVTITTSRSIMDQIGVVKVYVDVGGQEGPIKNREVPINVYDNQGNELSVRMDRETAVISVEFVQPSKTVPVSIETTGELPEGLSLTSVTADVDEVEVFAVSAILETIDSISTEEIDLFEISESGTVEVELNIPEGVIIEDVETIEVDLEVEETRVIEDVSIELNELDDGREAVFVDPANAEMAIEITGDESVINQFSRQDFLLSVNAADLDPGEHTVSIDIEWDELEDVIVAGELEEATIMIE